MESPSYVLSINPVSRLWSCLTNCTSCRGEEESFIPGNLISYDITCFDTHSHVLMDTIQEMWLLNWLQRKQGKTPFNSNQDALDFVPRSHWRETSTSFLPLRFKRSRLLKRLPRSSVKKSWRDYPFRIHKWSLLGSCVPTQIPGQSFTPGSYSNDPS